MADQKISELTSLTGANLNDADLLAVVDSSAPETKSITVAELKTGLGIGSGGGSYEYISSGTASSSASVALTLPSGYDAFEVKLSNIYPATDGAELYAEFDTGSHEFTRIYQQLGSASGSVLASSSNGGEIAVNVGKNVANEMGASGTVWISGNYSSSTVNTNGQSWLVYQNSGNTVAQYFSSFESKAVAVSTSITFTFNSGNIESGTFTLYGIKAG